MGAKFISKLSLKTVGVQPTETNKPTEYTPLMDVYGIANGYKTGTSNYGEFVKFTGNFEATNLLTGEAFASGYLLLPPPITAMLRQTIDATNAKGDSAGFAFAVQIGVRPAKNPIGYEYTTESLRDSGTADPLAQLREDARAASAKLLSGPEEKGKAKHK